MKMLHAINLNDPHTINFDSVEAFLASEEDGQSKQLYIRPDGSLAILHQGSVPPPNFEDTRVDLNNGGYKRWGVDAVRNRNWVEKVCDELLKRVPNQHKGFIED